MESTASIASHPVHPMLIAFPIAFLVGALMTDVVFWATGAAFWASMSIWLIGAGFVMGIFAGAVGFIDFWTLSAPRETISGWIHAIGNIGVLSLALANLLVRSGDPQGGVLPWGIALSAATTVLLAVTTWYGGELTYRHRIGVMTRDSSRPPLAQEHAPGEGE